MMTMNIETLGMKYQGKIVIIIIVVRIVALLLSLKPQTAKFAQKFEVRISLLISCRHQC